MSKDHDKGTVADAADPVVLRMASGAHEAVDQGKRINLPEYSADLTEAL